MPKESQQKSTTLGVAKHSELCPVTTLYTFIQKTFHFRQDLPEDHTLFLTYLDDRKQTTSIIPMTVANWIKTDMKEAGIDTNKYTPRSIRSASSTKAIQMGFSFKEVKDHANWSNNSQTMEKYYYKPNNKDRTSTAMINSLTENTTISGVRTKATSIGVGTSCNTNVAVVKTKDMVNPTPANARPWYKKLLEMF
ncbi:hypothetical protein G6F62_012312 [Rhizopus arrhizus]|nr:hypothetical protein G6F62_012312 [Rhizopus arrhizus]